MDKLNSRVKTCKNRSYKKWFKIKIADGNVSYTGMSTLKSDGLTLHLSNPNK